MQYSIFILYAGKPMTISFESIKSLSKEQRAYETEKILAKKIGDNFSKSKITYLKA